MPIQDELPEAKRIATLAWEQVYDRERWQAFLAVQGYQPLDRQVFLKERVEPAHDHDSSVMRHHFRRVEANLTNQLWSSERHNRLYKQDTI